MDAEAMRAVELALWLEGADAYRRHLADAAIIVTPGATLDRDATIAAIERSARWREVERHDERILTLGSGAMLIHYRAEAVREDGTGYAALVSSLYEPAEGRPMLVFHQQTPLP